MLNMNTKEIIRLKLENSHIFLFLNLLVCTSIVCSIWPVWLESTHWTNLSWPIMSPFLFKISVSVLLQRVDVTWKTESCYLEVLKPCKKPKNKKITLKNPDKHTIKFYRNITSNSNSTLTLTLTTTLNLP